MRHSLATAIGVALLALGGCGGTTASGPEHGGRDGGAAQTAKAADPSRYSKPVPILMYHAIGDATSGGGLPELWVSATDFRAQMGWLASHGWHGVRLDRVERAWRGKARLPSKPVVISFDDGYTGQETIAAPELQRRGWPGVAFLKAGLGGLTLAQAKRLVADGWEIGAHSINHPDLTTLDAKSLHDEVYFSGRLLRKALGVKVRNFAYPAGDYDRRVEREVERDGYEGAVTVEPGWASRSKPYEMRRVRVPGTGGLAAIRAALGD